MIRVFIVSHDAAARHLLSQHLAADPELEVVGFASNNHLAVAKILRVNPDVVTLDIERTAMDGIAAIKEIRQSYPKLPMIVIGAATPNDAAGALDALDSGASDYVADPFFRDELIPKIKALCAGRAGFKPVLSVKASRRTLAEKIGILAIGTSTGGPNALTEVLAQLPVNFPVPIVIVQHMPMMFTKLLAARLSTKCPMPVSEGKTGDILKPGQAWLAPGDYHMELQRDGNDVRVVLHQQERENACRPSVDVLLRSVAGIYGASTLAVIMTGMGSDGLLGCRRLRACHAQIIVQDEATSVVWGMPGAVARDGLADKVVPLLKIAGEILERVQCGRTALRH